MPEEPKAAGEKTILDLLREDLRKDQPTLDLAFQSVTLEAASPTQVVLRVARDGISPEELLPRSQQNLITRRIRKAAEKIFGVGSKVKWSLLPYQNGAASAQAPSPESPAPVAKQDTNDGHSEHSPSVLHNYEKCPSYIKKQGTNPAAEAGTRMHKAVELDAPGDLEDPEEQLLVEYVISKREQVLNQIFKDRTEVKDFRELKVAVVPGESGTIDHFSIRGPLGVALDWKFGRGGVEDADMNLQGWAYGKGLFDKFPEMQVLLIIFVLPRQEKATVAKFTRIPDYDRFEGRILTTIARKQELGGKVFNPAEQLCIYCNNMGKCEAWHKKALHFAKAFGDDTFTVPEQPTSLDTPAAISQALKLCGPLENLIEQIRSRARQAAFDEGLDIPGFDKCYKSSARKVINPYGTYSYLQERCSVTEDEFYACVSGVGIGDLEKLLKEKAPEGASKAEFAKNIFEELASQDCLAGGDTKIGYLRASRSSDGE